MNNRKCIAGIAFCLAIISLTLVGCGSSGESAADRATRLKKESPQMQEMRKDKADG